MARAIATSSPGVRLAPFAIGWPDRLSEAACAHGAPALIHTRTPGPRRTRPASIGLAPRLLAPPVAASARGDGDPRHDALPREAGAVNAWRSSHTNDLLRLDTADGLRSGAGGPVLGSWRNLRQTRNVCSKTQDGSAMSRSSANGSATSRPRRFPIRPSSRARDERSKPKADARRFDPRGRALARGRFHRRALREGT